MRRGSSGLRAGAAPTTDLYSAFCRAETCNTGLAIHDLDRALSEGRERLLPTALVGALSTLASRLAESGQHGRAARVWDEAVKLTPEPAEHLRAARSLRLAGRPANPQRRSRPLTAPSRWTRRRTGCPSTKISPS